MVAAAIWNLYARLDNYAPDDRGLSIRTRCEPIGWPTATLVFARSDTCWIWSCLPPGWASLPSPSFMPLAATVSEERAMLIDYVLGGVVTVALLVYLTYALLRPEQF
jgi:K+-transporting ATPase KdpF subunit